ncbi:unnamed protein product [Kuraishia capsulata CBS 1993]|uniref:Uncharacterized protein n=1 Tax=Kuraishia capsulata CBS 1993 TaxID=1382522 RepID=W6MT08_9ASCO|nr:unnamed protein product [Kuraishia capsulata CBS 1993]
MSASTYFVRK